MGVIGHHIVMPEGKCSAPKDDAQQYQHKRNMQHQR